MSEKEKQPNICSLMTDDLLDLSSAKDEPMPSNQTWRKRDKRTPVQLGAFTGSLSDSMKS